MELPGVEPYTSVSLLPKRFTDHGFVLANALTLKDIKLQRVSKRELQRYILLLKIHTVLRIDRPCRVKAIERLDEVEELDPVLAHYAISWGLALPNTGSSEEWLLWDMRWEL